MIFDVLLPAMRRRMGKSFRKSLGVYSYKVRTPHSHKKPGVIPFNIKQRLLEVIKTQLHKINRYSKTLIDQEE